VSWRRDATRRGIAASAAARVGGDRSGRTSARIVCSRLYLCVDVLWLAVEQSVALFCAESLFPGLVSLRPQAGLAALGSGVLWLLLSRRRRAGLRDLDVAPHAQAARGALGSLVWRTLLVMATLVCLGLWAGQRGVGSVPLPAVAFLLWAAAVVTPLLDAGRALLEYQAAVQILADVRRRAAAGSGPAQALHALAAQLERDTLPTRVLLLGLTVLGVTLAAGLPLFSLTLAALSAGETVRLLPLLFAAPALLLVAVVLGVLYVHVRLQIFARQAGTKEVGNNLSGMLWLPRGVAGTTLVVGLLLLFASAIYAHGWLAVSTLPLVLLAAPGVSVLAAAAVAQWAILRLFLDDVRERQGPGVLHVPPPRRFSEAVALRKARRSIGWATVAVLAPPLVGLLAIWGSRSTLSFSARGLVGIGGLGFLLLALFTTLLRLRSSLRPLAEATRQAAALSAAPHEVSAGPEQRADIGRRRTRLAQTLQAMQDALRQRLVSSTQAQARLEAEVAERTSELLQRNLDIEQNIRLLSEAQAALSEAEGLAAIGQFVAGIAHEINNPINAALNAARPLREALAEIQPDHLSEEQCTLKLRDADLAAMLRVLQRGTQRAEEIVRALFSYTEPDAQARGPVDVHRVLDDAWELLQHPAKSAIELTRRDGAQAPVQSHEGRLQQVFVNLLGNAVFALSECHATRSDFVPRIVIETSEEDGFVHIAIRDNGPGIPRALQARIFEPFFTTKDPTQGSGLGLSIAHSIIVRQGGRLELASAPGQGARFVVILPIALAAASPKGRAPSARS